MSTVASPPYRLLVIARDPLVRAGLSALASAGEQLQVVGQVQPDDDLYRSATTFGADLALWDITLLDDETKGWLTSLQEDSRRTLPVLAMVDDPDVASRLWNVGLRGVLRREISPEELTTAVHAVQNGFRLLDLEFGDQFSHLSNGHDYAPVEPLTPREMEVLQLLAEGLSNKQIGRTLSISEHTVKFHVNAILSKFDVQSRTEAVVYATRAGLIFL